MGLTSRDDSMLDLGFKDAWASHHSSQPEFDALEPEVAPMPVMSWFYG